MSTVDQVQLGTTVSFPHIYNDESYLITELSSVFQSSLLFLDADIKIIQIKVGEAVNHFHWLLLCQGLTHNAIRVLELKALI